MPKGKRPTSNSYAPALQVVSQPAAPWDRMPGESDAAYSFFLEYRDLNPRVRSLAEMVRRERERRDANPDAVPVGTLSVEQLSELSGRFEWPRRAQLWDDYLRVEQDVAIVSAARNASKETAAAALDAMDFGVEFFRVLKLRGVEQGMLNKTDFQTLLKTLPAAIRSSETAMKMLRLLSGESTENLAVRGQLLIAGDRQIDLSRVDHTELRETRDLLRQLLTQPQPATAAHDAPLVVDGEFRET